jgi:hypothetical protein
MISSPQSPTSGGQITILSPREKNNRSLLNFKTFSLTLWRIDSLSNTMIEAHAKRVFLTL